MLLNYNLHFSKVKGWLLVTELNSLTWQVGTTYDLVFREFSIFLEIEWKSKSDYMCKF